MSRHSGYDNSLDNRNDRKKGAEKNRPVVEKEEVIIYKLFNPLIEGYKFEEDLDKYALDSICTILSENIRSFDDSKLAKLAILINKKGIGCFAFTFKSLFVQNIEEQNYSDLKQLLTSDSELFTELFENNYLKEEDKAYLNTLYEKEYFAFMLSINKIREGVHIDSNTECKKNLIFAKNDKILKIFNDCYDEVCFSENEVTGRYKMEDILDLADIPAEDIYIVDKDETNFNTYCLKLEELLESLSSNPPINPKTEEEYSDFSKKILYENYNKEICMYRKFIDNCDGGFEL